jgi:hypothetical protein
MQAFLSIVLTALTLLKPAPDVKPSPHEHLLVHVERTVPVAVRPGGPRLATVGSTTPFGSARVLSVVGRRGHWLHVTTADLPSGRNGWVDEAQPGLAVGATKLSLQIHLGARTLELRNGDRLVRTVAIGVGAPATPTPTGRFAVTDKLQGPAFSPVYGCCVLALSAQQTHLPAGWHGGNRIAIHGTTAPSSIGEAVSTGCLHAGDADLRYLMARVPLGTPVTISS